MNSQQRYCRVRPHVLIVSALLIVTMTCVTTRSFAQQNSAARRPITVDDYFQVREVEDPQISADGQWVAYTVSTASLKDDKNESCIWMVAAAGGDPIAMTAEGVSSSHPRWSP